MAECAGKWCQVDQNVTISPFLFLIFHFLLAARLITDGCQSERQPARAVMSDRSESAQLLQTNVCSTLLQNLPISARLMDLRPLAGVWCSGARTQQIGPDTSQTLWETHMESVKNEQNKYCNILSGTVSYWNSSATNWSKSCTPGNQTHTGPRFWSRVWMLMF